MGYVSGFQNRRAFHTKNLGWLRAHSSDIERFELAEYERSPHGRALLVAHLRGGGTFISMFESFAVALEHFLRRPSFRGLPLFRCFLEMTVEPDDIPVRGNAQASDNDADDRAAEDEIIRRLDSGDVWAWAAVTLKATLGDHSAQESLGACSYQSQRDFESLDGYFGDMCQSAIAQCRAQVLAACGTDEEV